MQYLKLWIFSMAGQRCNLPTLLFQPERHISSHFSKPHQADMAWPGMGWLFQFLGYLSYGFIVMIGWQAGFIFTPRLHYGVNEVPACKGLLAGYKRCYMTSQDII